MYIYHTISHTCQIIIINNHLHKMLQPFQKQSSLSEWCLLYPCPLLLITMHLYHITNINARTLVMSTIQYPHHTPVYTFVYIKINTLTIVISYFHIHNISFDLFDGHLANRFNINSSYY